MYLSISLASYLLKIEVKYPKNRNFTVANNKTVICQCLNRSESCKRWQWQSKQFSHTCDPLNGVKRSNLTPVNSFYTPIIHSEITRISFKMATRMVHRDKYALMF